MTTAQSALLAPAVRLLEAEAPGPVALDRLYDAVERAVALDADDLVPPTLRGRPTKEPGWHRNLRNALKAEKVAGRLANVAPGYWTVARPDAERHVDPDRAWAEVVAAARRSVGDVFESPSRGRRYRVSGADDGRITIDRLDASKAETLSPVEVRRAVVALNAAGGRTGARTLNYTVTKETALVHLHPDLDWDGGRVVARDRRGTPPSTAAEALDRLTRDQLLGAIAALDAGAETAFADSRDYDVVHDGRRYAPLRVAALAAESVFGRPLRPHSDDGDPASTIKGGLGSPCFRALERNGFDVVRKREPADGPYPDEVEPVGPRAEGGRVRVWVDRYERDPALRDACLAHYGSVCRVCEVDMAETYGPLGAGYVHVHHVRPLAAGGERETDPVADLVPVCPNCHAMLHRGRAPDDPRAVGALRAAVQSLRRD
ncbi:HNH endonuclease [Rubrivirga marina]|uniref:HNH nuclease domain-containing protein n=1 Tax=Rubrivirga marina TaxID=1196024 RepID=A0A271IV07_9BACT|nr:HNH endonuclease [Rubrivirga marina]PAP75076.1 hypothetical protein BSZ37_00725 [Rubrivirga marina]